MVVFCSVTTLVVAVILPHGVFPGGNCYILQRYNAVGSCYITPLVPSVLVVVAPAGTRTGHCIVSRRTDRVRNVSTISAPGSRAVMEIR